MVPRASAERPLGFSIDYFRDADAKTAHWGIATKQAPLPASFPGQWNTGVLAYNARTRWTSPAPLLQTPVATAHVLSIAPDGAGRRIRLALSPGGGNSLALRFPKDAKVTTGLTDKSSIVGKITKERIIKGEPILLDRLYSGGKTNMSFMVPAGKRAITIGANEVTEVGNFIIPGDYVDVIATFEEATSEINGKKVFIPSTRRSFCKIFRYWELAKACRQLRKRTRSFLSA
jgi:Flp pilus assembly protein CpaB